MTRLPVGDLLMQAPERDRPDAGDVSDLIESIREVGLLHPPVVTPEGMLVAGLRRVTACAAMGWDDIPVTVVHNLTDARAQLRAEWDENAVRRALTPEEAARARRRRAEILQPLVKPGPRSVGDVGNLPTGRILDAAADGLGYSRRTLDKVDYLLDAAEDDALPEEVRDAAVQAVGEINDGHPVDPAHKAVKAEVVRQKAVDADWSERDRELRVRVEAGETVVANIRTDRTVIAWAESVRKYVRIDRRTDWGNPFLMDKDGDRATVIANYQECFLPNKPSLDPSSLRGKLLGCWCSPEPCHGDVLKAAAG